MATHGEIRERLMDLILDAYEYLEGKPDDDGDSMLASLDGVKLTVPALRTMSRALSQWEKLAPPTEHPDATVPLGQVSSL